MMMGPNFTQTPPNDSNSGFNPGGGSATSWQPFADTHRQSFMDRRGLSLCSVGDQGAGDFSFPNPGIGIGLASLN